MITFGPGKFDLFNKVQDLVSHYDYQTKRLWTIWLQIQEKIFQKKSNHSNHYCPFYEIHRCVKSCLTWYFFVILDGVSVTHVLLPTVSATADPQSKRCANKIIFVLSTVWALPTCMCVCVWVLLFSNERGVLWNPWGGKMWGLIGTVKISNEHHYKRYCINVTVKDLQRLKFLKLLLAT